MSDIRDDYLKFNVDGERSNDSSFMSTMIKGLVVVLLLLGVVVLGALAYKFLFKDKSNNPVSIKQQKVKAPTQTVEQKVVNAVQNSGGSVKKEEIAAIVKSVLTQMQQRKPQQVQKVTHSNATTTGSNTPTEVNDDAALLNTLQSTKVDNTKNEDIDLSSLDNLDSKKEIDNKSSKKQEDTFNKVVINKQEIATKDDLAKIYDKLNNIMKKDKNRVKKSSYTKMISGETKVRANEMRIIVVRRGDTLSKIAKRAYGNAMMYNKIYAANPDIIKNPNMIHIGQRLRVPK